MKKILLAAALFAVVSLNSFGANCSFNLATAPVSCTVTGTSSGSWTLTNFSFTQASSLGYLNGANIAAGNINMAVVSTANGFDVTVTSAVTGNGINFFAPSGLNQQSNFKTGFWVNPTTGGTSGFNSVTGIDNIQLAMNTPAGTNFYSVTKEIQNLNGSGNLISPTQVFYAGTNTNCTQVGTNPNCYYR